MTTRPTRDGGFTLVEVIIVVMILGVLTSIVTFAVTGLTGKSKSEACGIEKGEMLTAVEAYFGMFPNELVIATATYPAIVGIGTVAAPSVVAVTTAVPAPAGAGFTAGATPAETLQNAKLLKSTSTLIFVESNGTLRSNAAMCAPVGTKLG